MELTSYDTESNFNATVSEVNEEILSEGILGQHSRRILQKRCQSIHPELLNSYRSSSDNPKKSLRRLILKSEHDYLSIFKFLFLWIGGFFFYPVACVLSDRSLRMFVYFEAAIESFSSLSVFENVFCQKIAPRAELQGMKVVIPGKYPAESKLIVTVKHLPFGLFLRCNLRLRDIATFYSFQMSSLTMFFTGLRTTGLTSLAWKDFITRSYFLFLGKQGLLKAYVKTNSQFADQQLWLEDPKKNFEYFMLWYSTNTKYFKFKNYSSHDHYQYNLCYLEKNLTWAKWHGEWIKGKQPLSSIILCEPLVFGHGLVESKLPDRALMIFDVSPRERSLIDNLFVDSKGFYYSLELGTRFLNDVVHTARKYGFTPCLKNKRKSDTGVSETYLNNVRELVEAGSLRLISPDADVESLIKKSSAVVSIPFTSTNYVAASQGIPSIYYDPSGSLEYTDRDSDTSIKFAGTIEELDFFFRKLS